MIPVSSQLMRKVIDSYIHAQNRDSDPSEVSDPVPRSSSYRLSEAIPQRPHTKCANSADPTTVFASFGDFARHKWAISHWSLRNVIWASFSPPPPPINFK